MPTTKTCKDREFYRNSYTRTLKNGKIIKIKGKCIRSQSPYSKLNRDLFHTKRRYTNQYETIEACRKKYSKSCKTDRGSRAFRNLTQKSIGPLRKGELKKYGYSNVIHTSVIDRHNALQKAIEQYDLSFRHSFLDNVYERLPMLNATCK